jgi:hypothetical protein
MKLNKFAVLFFVSSLSYSVSAMAQEDYRANNFDLEVAYCVGYLKEFVGDLETPSALPAGVIAPLLASSQGSLNHLMQYLDSRGMLMSGEPGNMFFSSVLPALIRGKSDFQQIQDVAQSYSLCIQTCFDEQKRKEDKIGMCNKRCASTTPPKEGPFIKCAKVENSLPF